MIHFLGLCFLLVTPVWLEQLEQRVEVRNPIIEDDVRKLKGDAANGHVGINDEKQTFTSYGYDPNPYLVRNDINCAYLNNNDEDNERRRPYKIIIRVFESDLQNESLLKEIVLDTDFYSHISQDQIYPSHYQQTDLYPGSELPYVDHAYGLWTGRLKHPIPKKSNSLEVNGLGYNKLEQINQEYSSLLQKDQKNQLNHQQQEYQQLQNTDVNGYENEGQILINQYEQHNQDHHEHQEYLLHQYSNEDEDSYNPAEQYSRNDESPNSLKLNGQGYNKLEQLNQGYSSLLQKDQKNQLDHERLEYQLTQNTDINGYGNQGNVLINQYQPHNQGLYLQKDHQQNQNLNGDPLFSKGKFSQNDKDPNSSGVNGLGYNKWEQLNHGFSSLLHEDQQKQLDHERLEYQLQQNRDVIGYGNEGQMLINKHEQYNQGHHVHQDYHIHQQSNEDSFNPSGKFPKNVKDPNSLEVNGLGYNKLEQINQGYSSLLQKDQKNQLDHEQQEYQLLQNTDVNGYEDKEHMLINQYDQHVHMENQQQHNTNEDSFNSIAKFPRNDQDPNGLEVNGQGYNKWDQLNQGYSSLLQKDQQNQLDHERQEYQQKQIKGGNKINAQSVTQQHMIKKEKMVMEQHNQQEEIQQHKITNFEAGKVMTGNHPPYEYAGNMYPVVDTNDQKHLSSQIEHSESSSANSFSYGMNSNYHNINQFNITGGTRSENLDIDVEGVGSRLYYLSMEPCNCISDSRINNM